MYILDINKSIIKTIITYLGVSIFAVVFDKIYSLYSHGVSSLYMDLMFLYPLIGGVLVYCVIAILIKNINYNKYRISFNIYNSGSAILTVGSLLRGIFEIAGTSSIYVNYYTIFGVMCIIIGVLSILIIEFKEER